jgi:hypothetical protein
MFVNFLLQHDETESGFKEKIFGRKELQQYLTAKNLENFKPNPKSLDISKYGQFEFSIGYPQTEKINAGGQFFQMIEVEKANSIILVGFQTVAYDIQFGFMRVTHQSLVIQEGDDISHKNME